MKVQIRNLTEFQRFLQVSDDSIAIPPKGKIIINIGSDTELIELAKRYRPHLVFKKINL